MLTEAREEAASYTWLLSAPVGSSELSGARGLYTRYPQLPEVRLLWALALYRNEESREQVILFLEKRLDRDTASWACRDLLAEIYENSGDAKRAEALRAEAERERPDTPEALYLRSFATLDPEQAVRYAEQAVDRYASTTLEFLARQRLAHLRFAAGDLDGALQEADRLIELANSGRYLREQSAYAFGSSFVWVTFKGHVLVRQGRVREGIECYQACGNLPPVAHAYRRLKEYDKAVVAYTELIDGASNEVPDVYHLYQRATPLWILGRTEEALADYRRVRILLGRPFYADARQFLILQELDRPGEAREVLEAALRDVKEPWLRRVFRCLAGEVTPDELVAAAAPGNLEQLCEAHYYAGEVHLLSGDRQSARKCFERCVRTGVDFDPTTEAGTPMNEFELAQWRLDTLFP